MIFGYNAYSGMLRKKSLLVAMGMVAIPLSFHFHSQAASLRSVPTTPTVPPDPRVARLHGFLSKLDCPVASMADDFVRAADQNHLDWRLLPSIAVIESGGGKAYKNNNIFGWNNGEQAFESIRSGLELVAYKLGHSPLYRRHDSLGKLRIYNENQSYASSVISVMNRISPVSRLQPVADSGQRIQNMGAFSVIQY
jgi:hypothetical protein